MNKVIEADFLPRETNAGFSWPNSIGGSGMKEMRRILIIDDDADTTHAAGETPAGPTAKIAMLRVPLPKERARSDSSVAP
ncbi:MAG: hypothetical protein DME95_03370 [Verrucomicrobia bacterium]|nr:MAG: hypothetical protein DME95_03370 [Verrucomicrobiota bacterium]